MVKKIKIIGTDSLNYNQLRNFAGLKPDGYQFKKVRDAYKFINHAYFKLYKKPHPFYHYFFKDYGINNVDLFHFFNTVYFGKKPWVNTFENDLPRHNPNYLPGLKALANDNCIQIIGFCKRAVQVQQYLMEKQEASLKNRIYSKTIVLQPSQKLHLNNFEEKPKSKIFTFSFVGVDFYRKGGQEILLSAQKLLAMGYVFELNIVSKLQIGGWKDQHIKQEDKNTSSKILIEKKEHIKQIQGLNNTEVIELFKRSDVALLPSYGETFGYVVLEAQACGVPVITTNMPPFEEFNNDDRGWLCDVPLILRNGIRDSDVYSQNGLNEFRNTLEKSVFIAMKDALDNPEKTKTKGKNALEYIRQFHNPIDNIRTLSEIYGKV